MDSGAVQPLTWCPHLETLKPVPPTGINIQQPCDECASEEENWICLSCYKVLCGRFVNEHMVMHGVVSSHPLVLSFSDLSVWCYPCEAYIDNKSDNEKEEAYSKADAYTLLIPNKCIQALYEAKNTAHLAKFGQDMPVPAAEKM